MIADPQIWPALLHKQYAASWARIKSAAGSVNKPLDFGESAEIILRHGRKPKVEGPHSARIAEG
jgi:hypothetical protein